MANCIMENKKDMGFIFNGKWESITSDIQIGEPLWIEPVEDLICPKCKTKGIKRYWGWFIECLNCNQTSYIEEWLEKKCLIS